MRIALVVLLSTVLHLGSLMQLSALIDFAAHYTTIVNELCEQKDAPVNTCNGRCHMKAQLNAVAADDIPAEQQSAIQLPEIHYLPLTSELLLPQGELFTEAAHPRSAENQYAFLKAHAVFHPPAGNA
ncbi:MAG: hypothetical protein ACFCUH_07265 [Flavobacteriales bacterium]